MAKARTFTRTEIFDAARAAAETGLNVRLSADGVMEFLQPEYQRNRQEPTPEMLLDEWIKSQEGRQPRRLARKPQSSLKDE